MTKYEWERQLKKGISGLPKSEQQRVLDYYNELFADKIDAGLREQYIISEFGNPYDVANKILVDYYNEGKDNAEADEYIYSSSDDIDVAFDDEQPEPTVETPKRKAFKERCAEHREKHENNADIANAETSGEKVKNKGPKSASGLIFLIGVLLYCILGACFNLWHPSWLIFLLLPVIVSLVQAIHRRNWRIFAYPLFVVFLFLLIGFTSRKWHPAWILFITIPLYYILGDFIVKNTDGNKKTEHKSKPEKETPRNVETDKKPINNAETKKKEKNTSAASVLTTIAKVLLAICLVLVAIAVWGFVIELFIGGIGMTIGGIVCIITSAIGLFGGMVNMVMLGIAIALTGFGLICVFGMAALFKPCFNMCKSFINTIRNCFNDKEVG